MAKKGTTATLMKRSTIVLVLVLVIGFGSVLTRLFMLQVLDAEALQQKALNQQFSDATVSAKRGNIYDVNGELLAESISVWDVVMEPANFYDASKKVRKKIANQLAKILDLDAADLLERTYENSHWDMLKRKVDVQTKNKLAKLIKDAGEKYSLYNIINLEENYERYYTHDYSMGPVLGVVNYEGNGIVGLEYQYDEELKGNAGRVVVVQDARSSPLPYQYEKKIEASDGNSLVLTIDQNIQSIMEKYVRQTIKEFKVANRGCAIMMNVKTGAVLGFACEESFYNNEPGVIADKKKQKAIEALPEEEQGTAEYNALQAQWRNKGVSDTYIPGSVFKMVTASAVLSESLNDGKKYECDGAYAPFEGASAIPCWSYSGHGSQTLEIALCNSCNPAFMQMGFQLGREKFYDYVVAFGFREQTGIDLPAESDSIWFTSEDSDNGMGLMDLAVASFGQNFKITPIQMVTACAAIANGGKLMQPYVVSQIVDDSGNVVKTTEPKVRRQVISEDVARHMCETLEMNAVSGGATNGYVAGYRIGGKTGTSEKKVNDDGTISDDYIASFCGIAPCDDPEIALLCYFDTPDKDINYYGSAVAGPCFRNIMSEVLPYLGVEKIYSEDEKSQVDVYTDSYTGLSTVDAEREVKADGLKPEIVGNGETVIAQNPQPYSVIPKEGTVILYTDEDSQNRKVTVPDFSNCSISDANYLAALNNLNVSIVGSSLGDENTYVKSQDIKAGKEVEPYTVVTLVFNQDNHIM